MDQMDHQMDQMAGMAEMLGGGGTYIGHVLPGLGLMLIAAIWLIQDFRGTDGAGANASDRPIQSGLLLPWFKIIVSAMGIWMEIPGKGWYPMDVMMGWQHATVHSAIFVSGLTDLLHLKGRLSARATYIAWGGAMLVGAAIFLGHGNHDGMSTMAHLLLGGLFFSSALLALLEGFVMPGLRSLRQAAVMATGGWLAVIGWIIFASGWDPMSMISTSWVWTMFCWNGLAVALVYGGVALVKGEGTSA